jgi:antitoxin VapB
MTATAKVFTTGNSQAVRLPKAFRLEAKEVWISRNEATGEIVLRPRPDERARRREIEDLIREIREVPVTEEFIPPRDDAYRPDPFDDDGSVV